MVGYNVTRMHLDIVNKPDVLYRYVIMKTRMHLDIVNKPDVLYRYVIMKTRMH